MKCFRAGMRVIADATFAVIQGDLFLCFHDCVQVFLVWLNENEPDVFRRPARFEVLAGKNITQRRSFE
jgi:hypothetical protein